MRKIKACLYVNPDDRATLERLVADGKTAQKIVARARVVLASGRGLGTSAIMREARLSKPAVWRWQDAFMAGGVARLLKGKGPKAGKTPISCEVRLAIVTKTAKEKPANATHWSARTMAKAMGVGHRSVQRIWKEHGLKPHLTRTFKLSNDPKFAEKVVDVVGLYMNPPDKAVVLCIDEKSQIQAPDQVRGRSHATGVADEEGSGRDDDARLQARPCAAWLRHDGTTTFFAALDVKTGQVIGECLAETPRQGVHPLSEENRQNRR